MESNFQIFFKSCSGVNFRVLFVHSYCNMRYIQVQSRSELVPLLKVENDIATGIKFNLQVIEIHNCCENRYG